MSSSQLLDGFGSIPESFTEFQSRYEGFVKELFAELQKILQVKGGEMTFFKGTLQPEDAYATLKDRNRDITIQLDPLTEKIILWNGASIIESGDWYNEPIAVAIYAIENWSDLVASSWKNWPF